MRAFFCLMPFYNYILYSKNSDLYYKGYTENYFRRLSEHNSDKGRYSDGKGPWVLVYIKECPTKRYALIEERRLKRLNRRSLEMLIQSSGNEVMKFNSQGSSVG